MSLLWDEMKPCVMIDKTTVDDGYGGQKVVWVKGASFNAFIRMDSNLETKIAEKAYGLSYVSIVTPYNINLKVNDVVQRVSDSKIFRVTSDSDDFKVPGVASATMKVKKASAEEWTLPDSNFD